MPIVIDGTGTISGVNATGISTAQTVNAANISTGTVAAANGGTGLSSPGTAGNILTSNGTAWVSSAPAASGMRYFYAYRTATQFVTNNTSTLVQLNNAEQSQTSFNTGTYTWTATASDAGVWMFTGQVSFYDDDNGGVACNPQFFYNNALDAGNYGFQRASSTGNIRHFTCQNQMIKTISTGDTVKLYAMFNVGGNPSPSVFGGDASGGYRQTSMIGVKIA